MKCVALRKEQTMKDTIYRYDAIKEIEAEACLGIVECQESWLIDRIKAIPSVDRPTDSHAVTYINALENRIKELEADRPQGEWIEVYDGTVSGRCSICGWESHLYEDDVCGMPYCPNCGCRMKGADDE